MWVPANRQSTERAANVRVGFFITVMGFWLNQSNGVRVKSRMVMPRM
jgi:hypothetical protein